MKSDRNMIGGTKMHLQEIKELDKAYYMNTFGARRDVAFDHGKGITLYDTDGNAYTDFLPALPSMRSATGILTLSTLCKSRRASFTYVESVLY